MTVFDLHCERNHWCSRSTKNKIII